MASRHFCRAILFAAVLSLQAQQPMPIGITHGAFIEAHAGILAVRLANGTQYDCSWDDHTLFMRRQWPIHASDLVADEPVEVIADRRPGTQICYARIFAVVDPATRRPTRPRTTAPEPTDVWHPRGYLNLAGLVTEMAAGQLTILTREGPRTLTLQPDTFYSGDGLKTTEPETLVNKHVFVRAGKNLYGVMQAYKVMWGDILPGN